MVLRDAAQHMVLRPQPHGDLQLPPVVTVIPLACLASQLQPQGVPLQLLLGEVYLCLQAKLPALSNAGWPGGCCEVLQTADNRQQWPALQSPWSCDEVCCTSSQQGR